MFRSHVTVALRNLGRYKGYAFIKIAGLAVGMAVSLLIFLFVQNELGCDRYHLNLDRIYRLELGGRFAVLPPAVAPAVTAHIPEIQKAVRFTDGERVAVRYHQRTFSVPDFVWVDEDVFDIFSFTFLYGDPETALDAPFSMVITETVARSIFGDAYPIGEMIRGNNAFDVTVTGVIKDVENFHIPVSALGSFSTLEESYGKHHFDDEYEDDWAYATYVLLPESHDKTVVEGKIDDFFRESEIYGDRDPETHLQPLKGLYFLESGKLGEGYRKQGDIELVYMLAAIALAVLLVASINTVNLSTATATYRAKEVGVRKSLGASRASLILQFLVESVLIAAASFVLALALVELLLPEFNTLVATSLTLKPLVQPLTLLSVVIGVLIVGFGAVSIRRFISRLFVPPRFSRRKKPKGAEPRSLEPPSLFFNTPYPSC
jgi:putative ABC transport system permease protein